MIRGVLSTTDPLTNRLSTDAEAFKAVQFLTQLGAAMVAAGASATEIRTSLGQAADAYTFDLQVTVMPTVVLVRLQGQHSMPLDVSIAMNRSLRLDQIAATWRLVEGATAGTLHPSIGLQRLSDIWDSPSRFSHALRLLGYALMSVGFGLTLHPSADVFIASLLLGLAVGEVLLRTEGSATLQTLLPVMTALGVGLVVFSATKYGLVAGPLLFLIPPLVTFLPGAMLTIGMMEVTAGDIVSGSSRLVAGTVQLSLLIFGLLIAALIVGLPTAEAFSTVGSSTFDIWEPWISVFLFGVGVYLHRSAPPKSLPWLLLVLLVAWAGQHFGALLAGGYLGGFMGAVAMTPVAYAVQRWPSAPPAMVSILPAFWLLVPGALGLITLTELVSDSPEVIVNDIGVTVYTMIAIALGVTVGQSMYRPLAAMFSAVPRAIRSRDTGNDGPEDSVGPG